MTVGYDNGLYTLIAEVVKQAAIDLRASNASHAEDARAFLDAAGLLGRADDISASPRSGVVVAVNGHRDMQEVRPWSRYGRR